MLTSWAAAKLVLALALTADGGSLGPNAPAVVTPPAAVNPVPAAPTSAPPAQPTQPAAEVVTGGGLTVNLAQALRMGLDHDRTTHLRAYDVMAARAAEQGAWSVYLPQATLNGTLAYSNTVAVGTTLSHKDQYGITAGVSQLLFDTGTGLFSIYRTHQLTKAAVFNQIVAQLDAAQTVANDFFGVLTAKALEKLDGELLAEAKREQDLAQGRFDSGTGSKLDILTAKVAVSNAAVTLSVASNATAIALAQLRRDLGLPPGAPLDVTEATVVPPVESGLKEALGLGQQRPSVGALEADARAAMQAYDSARLKRWVSLDVSASYDQVLATDNGGYHTYYLGATMTLPVFDGGSGRAAEDEAKAAWLSAKESVLQERDQVQVDIETSWLNYHDAQDRIKATADAVLLAAEDLRDTEESYRLGVASELDFANARTAYSQAETNDITTRLDRDLAAVSLRVAVGRLPLLDLAAAASGKEPGR
jgi:outer membrane protein